MELYNACFVACTDMPLIKSKSGGPDGVRISGIHCITTTVALSYSHYSKQVHYQLAFLNVIFEH